MKKITVPILCAILVLSTLSFAGSQAGPDLVVTFIGSVKDYNTNSTAVTAIVKNQGTTGTGAGFYVELNVTSAGVGGGTNKQTTNKWCTRLGAGVSTTVSAVFSGTGWANCHAKADVTNLILESNENNNSKGACIFAYIRDFDGTFEIPLDVGNISFNPAEIELVIDYVSPGMSVSLEPNVVFLGVDEVTQVMMIVEFEPGFTWGQVVILGVYSDGYTISPATIDFVDINP